MTDKELWNAIYARNRRQRDRDRKLRDLGAALPPAGTILGLQEFGTLLQRLREILEAPELESTAGGQHPENGKRGRPC